MNGFDRIYATIDLDAIKYNIEQMKQNISENCNIMAVIKADGYGHGAVPIAKEIEDIPYVFGFAVATSEEAFQLRKSGIKKPILILGYTFPGDYKELIRQKISVTVFRTDMLEELAAAASAMQESIKIHVKVDTGMSRIGIKPDDSGVQFVQKALETKGIELEGVFTHFARADEADKTSAMQQLSRFTQFTERIERELKIQIPYKHCANSAAIIELGNANFDLVRAGIILYGLWPSSEVCQMIVPLHPVMSIYSHIAFIKEVESGVPVSYGGTWITNKNSSIATIPIGYGDGYPRSLSNCGSVLIKGKRAPILGRVCMDQMMVDVSDLPEACEGDLVTLLGVDGKDQITAEEIGELSGRFNYEFVCDINKRVPRVYLRDGKIIQANES